MSKEIRDLCAEKIADYFTSAEELARKIVRDKISVRPSIKAVLWKENGLQNTVRELDKIMENNSLKVNCNESK